MNLPPRVAVPATPAIEGIDIRTLYDVDHGTLLGKGGFSEVLAVHHIPTNELRAIKVMERAMLVGKKGEMVTHEKEILRRTCHPNIVTLYETIQTPEKIYFALDLMNEDLFELIVRNKRINETLTRKIVFALLSAVNYLHEQSIVHRDIKPENILINVRYTGPLPDDMGDDGTSDSLGSGSAADFHRMSSKEIRAKTQPTSNTFENVKNINDIDPQYLEADVKLADFGLAKLVLERDVKSTPCGTSFYIAPEVIRGIEEQGARPLVTTQRLVKSVDVWSAGVVLYVLLCGRPPFHGQVKTGEERRALLKKIDHGVLFNPSHGWGSVSEEARDLVARMLEQESASRITTAECLRQPFFTKHGFLRPTPGGDPSQIQRRQQHLAVQRQRLIDIQNANNSNSAEDGVQPRGNEGGGAYVVGEGCASVQAQINQQQQQQQQKATTKKGGSHHHRHTTTAPADTSSNASGSPDGGGSGDRKKTKQVNFFNNVKYFFTGGSSGGTGSGGGHSEKDKADKREEREKEREMHAELAALQEELLEADDKDGDRTAYKPSAPVREQRPAKPAVMNPNAKVGPGALRK